MQLKGEATTRMIIEGQPGWRADANFEGTLDKLPLTAKLQEPFRADMRGELLELSSNFHWTGKADVHNFDLQAFGGGSALGIITGKLDVGGEMNAFHARGPVAGARARRRALSTSCSRATTPIAWSMPRTTRSRTKPPEATSKVRARSRPPRTDPNYCCTGGWRGLRWPLAARFTAETPQIFSSPDGEYRLEGLWPYAIAANGDLLVPQLDPMKVAIRGALHKDHLQSTSSNLGAFGGHALLAGEARWTPAESWALEGSVKGFNPADCGRAFKRRARFQHEGERRAVRRRQRRLRVQRPSRKAARQRGHRQRPHRSQGETGPSTSCGFAPATPASPSTATRCIARTRPRLQPRCGQPRIAGRGARGELHASGKIGGTSDAPVIKSPRRAAASSSGTSSVDKLAANIDLDWRGQRTSHADIAVTH
jgi:hypothetical protein